MNIFRNTSSKFNKGRLVMYPVISSLKLDIIGKKMIKSKTFCIESKKSEAASATIISKFLKENYPYSNVKLEYSECDIVYKNKSKCTDYVLSLNWGQDNKKKVAVQVKRMFKWKKTLKNSIKSEKVIEWNYIQQNCLIKKADNAIKESNKNVCDKYKWDSHILHIISSIPFEEGILNSIKKKNMAADLIIISYVNKENYHYII